MSPLLSIVQTEKNLAPQIKKFAEALIKDNTSFMPIRLDGTKAPDSEVLPKNESGKAVWGPLQHRLPTADEIETWYGNGKQRGIAIIQGNGREVIDIDVKINDNNLTPEQIANANKYRKELAREFLADERIVTIVRKINIVETPSGGCHLIYRCETTEGNQTLAELNDGSDGKPRVFIETRGDAGYVLAPPTPGYKLIKGKIEETPTITTEERATLFVVARDYSDYLPPEKSKRETLANWEDPDPARPGSIFNKHADWEDILAPHGWQKLYGDDDHATWRRPGKHWGISAETYGCLFFCYSTNAFPFEAWSNGNPIKYTKYQAYTVLNHAGDFSASAKDLNDKGFNETNYYPYGEFDKLVETLVTNDCWSSPAKPPEALTGIVEDRPKEEIPKSETQPNVKIKTKANIVAKAEISTKPEKAKLPQVEKDNPLYSYLWEGYHGKFLTETERNRRIKSTKEALQYVPPNSFFSDYLAWVLPTTDASVMGHIAASISAASNFINRRAWFRSGLDTYYLNFWIGIVAESGSRKSSTLGGAKKLISEDPDYGGNVLPDHFTISAVMDDLGLEIQDEWEKKGLPTAEEAHALCRQHECDNRLFARGIGFFHLSEIATMLSIMGKSFNDEMKALLTDWYDCPEWKTKKTKTQGKYFFYRPFVSILGASTVDWLVRGCNESDLMGGFLPRWLFFVTTKQDFVLSFRDPPNEEKLLNLREQVKKLKTYDGEVSYSEEALSHYDSWHKSFVSNTDSAVRSWAARMAIYVHKIALLYEAATTGSKIISTDNLRLACNLVERLKTDVIKLLGGQLSFDENERTRNKVLSVLQERYPEWVSQSEILRATHLKAKDLNGDIWPTLIESEIVEKKLGAVCGNGKQTAWFRSKA